MFNRFITGLLREVSTMSVYNLIHLLTTRYIVDKHTVTKLKLSLPITHDHHSHEPIPWKVSNGGINLII